MEIFKYLAYFHDGSLLDIQDDGKVIQFSVESVEVEREVFGDARNFIHGRN